MKAHKNSWLDEPEWGSLQRRVDRRPPEKLPSTDEFGHIPNEKKLHSAPNMIETKNKS